MSIFFVGERRAAPDPEPTPDVDAALQAISDRLMLHDVASAGNMTPGRAERLRDACRRIDPLVTKFIADNQTATQAAIVQFVQDNTDGAFPASRFVTIMKTNAGGTMALLRSTCYDEVYG